MKLFAVLLSVASIACAVQSIAVNSKSAVACPANCKSPDKELLTLVKKHYPKILKELEQKYPTLPSGALIKNVLGSIGKPNTGIVIHQKRYVLQ